MPCDGLSGGCDDEYGCVLPQHLPSSEKGQIMGFHRAGGLITRNGVQMSEHVVSYGAMIPQEELNVEKMAELLNVDSSRVLDTLVESHAIVGDNDFVEMLYNPDEEMVYVLHGMMVNESTSQPTSVTLKKVIDHLGYTGSIGFIVLSFDNE